MLFSPEKERLGHMLRVFTDLKSHPLRGVGSMGCWGAGWVLIFWAASESEKEKKVSLKGPDLVSFLRIRVVPQQGVLLCDEMTLPSLEIVKQNYHCSNH